MINAVLELSSRTKGKKLLSGVFKVPALLRVLSCARKWISKAKIHRDQNMQYVFNELQAVTNNLLYLPEVGPYMSYADYMGRTVRRCRGGCRRWIRFCTAEYIVCGSCSDERKRVMDAEEDHRYGMKDVMAELISNREQLV
jgi:hypothetical protein